VNTAPPSSTRAELPDEMLSDSLDRRIAEYQNTEHHNDALFAEFNQRTWRFPLLAQHRRHIEENKLGFGEPAFHYLWWLILKKLKDTGSRGLLEIGVFKGQSVTAWLLVARALACPFTVTGITPLKGNPLPIQRWKRRLKILLSPAFREQVWAANFYPEDDYGQTIRNLMARFDLPAETLELIEGSSADPAVIARVAGRKFGLIYIDGDHAYDAVCADIRLYAPMIPPGGFLAMDDAACFLPGKTFWKGIKSVSEACETIPPLGFKNVINVGHVRLYQRSA
jgi:predicted O-methyltransferase YrrM